MKTILIYNKMRTIFIILFTTIIFTSCQSQNTDLSLRLEKGKEYKQVINSEITIDQEISGQKINMVMTINGTMTFLVTNITESGYDMESQYKKLSMSMKMPQGTMEFNSEKNNPNDIFSKILGAIIDKPFEVKMSKSGKVTDVKNVEALWENAINQFEQIPEAQKEQLRAQITKAYGSKALKGNIEMVTAIYPENPVKKGDKWVVNTNLESGMSAKVTTDYEFADQTADFALIKGNSSIKTADKDAYIENNGMPMKYDLEGTMSSEIKVDNNSGWIIEAKIKQAIEGDTYIKENPQIPNGMKIPMMMKSEMVITNK